MTISKETVKDFFKTFLFWGVLGAICDELLGPFFCMTTFGGILWPLTWIGVLWLFCFRPFWMEIQKGKLENDPMYKAAMEAKATEAKALQAEAIRPKVTPETLAIRTALTGDIRSCMADSGYTWNWADVSTVRRLYLYKGLDKSVAHPAVFTPDTDGKILHIDADIDGKAIRFTNGAYVAAKRTERAEKDAPIHAFFENTLPDTVWTWDNIDEGTIVFSSKAKKLDCVSGKLKWARDGHVTSISYSSKDGKVRYITARKPSQRAAGPSTMASMKPKTPIKPSGVENAVRVDDFTSVIVAPADMVEQRVETDITPEKEMAGSGLLAPIEDPPIDDGTALRNAEQLLEFIGLEIAEAAQSAELDGETFFVYKWPEGLQTLREAEFFAGVLLKRGTYPKVECNASNLTFKIYLPVS